jgi:hypothetical protein
MTKTCKNLTTFQILLLFYQNLQFTYPWASVKYVQDTGQAFSPRKRTSSTSKLGISSLFLFCGSFLPSFPDADPHWECESGSSRPNQWGSGSTTLETPSKKGRGTSLIGVYYWSLLQGDHFPFNDENLIF